MSQSLSMPSECQGFAALCLTLFAVAYNFSLIPLISIGIAVIVLSFTIASCVISFSLLTGLVATPFISTPWTIADLAHDGKAEEQVTMWMSTALVFNLFQTALVGLPYLLTMMVTLIMLLKYSIIDDPFSPKYVIYSGITLLGVGVRQLRTVGFIPGINVYSNSYGRWFRLISGLHWGNCRFSRNIHCIATLNGF